METSREICDILKDKWYQQPELISPAWGISVPKVPPQGPLQPPIPAAPQHCSSSQEEQRPDALVTPNGSCCYQAQRSAREAQLTLELQIKGCSAPSPGWAARGVWEMETSALGKTRPGVVFHPIPYRNAGCDVLGVLLSPPSFEPADHFQLPVVHTKPRRARQVHRQEQLPLLLLNPLPTRRGRQELPTATAADIRESTPKHHIAVPTPQILLLGERPAEPSPVPGEEDVCPRITAPKPRIRDCHKVASPGLENSWIGPGSITKGIKPLELPRTTNPRPSCGVISLMFLFALLLQCSSHFPNLIPAQTGPAAPHTQHGGYKTPLALMAQQDPASRPCYFLLGASSPAHPKGLQGSLPAHTLLQSQDHAGCRAVGDGLTSFWGLSCQTTLTTTSVPGKRGDRGMSSTHGWP